MLPDILNVALRSIGAIIVLFLLTKLIGKKQITQLTFFDYVNGITIGSIAAEYSFQKDLPFLEGVIVLSVYALITLSISIITNHSIIARRFCNSTSVLLIDNGKMIEKNMQKAHLDVNDLTSQARLSGYFNISDIQYAIEEPNGKISFLPYSDNRPITPKDLNLAVTPDGLSANVIIDGVIMKNNLKAIGRNTDWLLKKLKEQSVKDVQQILLATVDIQDHFTVFYKNEPPRAYNLFE